MSEGLDFANENGRAVIITGIPFPSTVDPRVKLKQTYLEEFAKTNKDPTKRLLSPNDWYVQQAGRAVNQAIGRVIRNRKDYGAILFCDDRFSNRQNQGQLSTWIRPHIRVYNKVCFYFYFLLLSWMMLLI